MSASDEQQLTFDADPKARLPVPLGKITPTYYDGKTKCVEFLSSRVARRGLCPLYIMRGTRTTSSFTEATTFNVRAVLVIANSEKRVLCRRTKKGGRVLPSTPIQNYMTVQHACRAHAHAITSGRITRTVFEQVALVEDLSGVDTHDIDLVFFTCVPPFVLHSEEYKWTSIEKIKNNIKWYIDLFYSEHLPNGIDSLNVEPPRREGVRTRYDASADRMTIITYPNDPDPRCQLFDDQRHVAPKYLRIVSAHLLVIASTYKDNGNVVLLERRKSGRWRLPTPSAEQARCTDLDEAVDRLAVSLETTTSLVTERWRLRQLATIKTVCSPTMVKYAVVYRAKQAKFTINEETHAWVPIAEFLYNPLYALPRRFDVFVNSMFAYKFLTSSPYVED